MTKRKPSQTDSATYGEDDTPAMGHDDAVQPPAPELGLAKLASATPETDDTAQVVQMTIAHVIFNRGLGHSLETCESLAKEIMQAVSEIEAV